jgi:glycosyltransferase involved in cell wall biosynthesis
MVIHAVRPDTAPPVSGRPRAATPADVLLVAEGCYPFHGGGVSVWCDQLIQGMPERDWRVAALSVDGDERPVWDYPPNLREVISIPLWGRRPRAARRHRRGTPPWFDEAHRTFLEELILPVSTDWPTRGSAARRLAAADAGEPSSARFLRALRAMFDYAQRADLTSALTSNRALGRLMEVWHAARADVDAAGTRLNLSDAAAAADIIEHLLRPLSYPPIPAGICHLSMNGVCALVGLACKWRYGTPLVMSEHGVYLRERYLSMIDEPAPHAVKVLVLQFFRALAGAAYQTADILAPHSAYNRRWPLFNGALSDRMRTMYNGVDPADFPAAPEPPEAPTIVFVGRVDPIKDLHTLLRAFALVRDEVPDARLRIFGPVSTSAEAYHRSCLALIDELGIGGAAVFEGRVADTVDAYYAGHLVALTSISEGFPYTLVEAMITGRPAVCTNVGGISEAVGDTGFVVPPRDHRAVAAACVKILRDPSLQRRLGLAARQRVLENFTLTKSLDAYRSVYTELRPGTGLAEPDRTDEPFEPPAPPLPQRVSA